MSVLIKNPITIVSGGSVSIEYGYVPGTVVPNTGYVEKVYVNTRLSFEEVEALLSSIEFSDGDFEDIILTEDDNKNIYCYKSNNSYQINLYFNGEDIRLWDNSSGWKEFDNPIEINSTVVNSRSGNAPVGTQNELLTTLFSTTPFEKITKTLSGTYDGNSIEANSNLIDMSALIDEKKIPLSIKVPEVLIEAQRETPVPNTGYVEKVYVNTRLSFEEVEALLSSIGFLEGGNYENILVTENNNKNIYIYKRKNSYKLYLYNGGEMDILLWDNSGWQEFDNPIEINSTVVNTGNGNAPVGTQNNLLVNLFSATPFEKINKTLLGTYDGNEITIKSGWDGTAIPNTGRIQNIYANTNLSFDEVLTELNKLTYVYKQVETSLDENKRGLYSVVNIPDLNLEILINVSRGDALIALSDYSLLIFATAGTDVGFVGWNTDLVANGGKIPLVSAAPVSEEDEDVPSYEVIPESYSFNGSSGAENSKITGLFSTTPFVYKEFDGVINLEEYIDNQKIPLNIKLDIGSNNGANDGAEVTLPNVVPNSGTVEKVYFNTALTIEEVVAELDKLTYTEISYAETSLEGATNHWNCLLNTDTANILVIVQDGQIAIVENYSGETLFTNTDGWNPDFSGEIDVNSEAFNGYEKTVAGVENYKITKLFSSTPEFSEEYAKKLTGTYDGAGITVTENGNVDILEAINNKQIPLNINVNVATPEVKVDDKVLTGTYDGSTIEVIENGTVDMSALIDEKKIPLNINVDIPDVTVDEKVLVGNYDGTAIEVANTTINISELLDEQKLPLSIEVKDVVTNATITAILNKDY